MRVLILAHEQDHSPGQCEKTAEVRMYVLELGTSHTQAESCLYRPTAHPGQEHTVFATYSSEGKMPIHARFTISELLYIY